MIVIDGGFAISAQPLDLVIDRRLKARRGTYVINKSHRGFLRLQRKMTPADLPIAIAARDLSAWSQRRVICGEVVRRGWQKGARPYNKVGSGFFAHFNGF